MKDRFFADCEVWVVESDMQKSPNRPLYELWKRQDWLYVCPGDVFNPDLAINQLMAKNEAGVNLRMFGYDPAQSKHPINTLKAWLQSLGLKSDVIKSMVVPVSQSFMTMNGVIDQLKTYVKTPWLLFSDSPVWPWMFGNAQVVTSRDDTLRKVIKSGQHNKVDAIHGLLDAMWCYELSEGNIHE